MIKIHKNKEKGKWFTYPEDKEVKFFIKPFPIAKTTIDFFIFNGKTELTEDDISNGAYRRMMMVCEESVLDWKGIVGDNDEPIPCNKSNKKSLFSNDIDIVVFVSKTATADENKLIEHLKNSQTSQSGSTETALPSAKDVEK